MSARIPLLDDANQIDPKHVPAGIFSRLDALEQAVYGGGGSIQTAKYTFEEGIQDQEPLPGVEDVTQVLGHPFYDVDCAAHGSLGIRCGTLGTKGSLRYNMLNAGSQQFSFYVTLFTFGEDATNILDIQNSAGGKCGSIRLRRAGSIAIYDAIDTEAVAVSDGKITEGRFRVDVKQTFVDGQQTITVQMTATGNMEGRTPVSDPIAYTFPADLPDRWTIGKNDSALDWDYGIDTIRISTDTVNWIDPENALPADQWHNFETAFDGPMVAGVNDIVAVIGSPQYATSAKKHGNRGVLCSGSSACRWQYSRLVPDGTTFRDIYLRIDTAGTGPIGVVQFMKNGAVAAQLGYKTGGVAAIYGPTATGSNHLVSSTNSVPKNGVNWHRIGFKVAYQPSGDQIVTERVYYSASDNGEGTTYEELTWTFPAAGAWDAIRFGTDLSWVIAFDDDRVSYTATNYYGPISPLETLTADYSLPGKIGPTTVDVASHVLGGGTGVRLAYSTTDGGGGVPGGTVLTLDATASYPTGNQDKKGGVGGFVKHAVTGLSGFTQYYAQLRTTADVALGQPIRFRTMPTPGSSFSGLKWILISCQGNSSGDYAPNAGGAPVQWGWKSAIAYAPDIGWHLGDYGYWGGNLKTTDDQTDLLAKYIKQTQGLASMEEFLHLCAMLQDSDDHEVSGNNGESFNDPITAAKNLAMQKQFAMHSIADTNNPHRANYGSYMIGDQIQVIVTDGYGMDRSPGTQLDNIAQNLPGHKTFWGDEQTEWFKETVTADVAVNLVISQKSPLGTPYGPTEAVDPGDTDKIHAYGSWLDDIIDHLDNELTVAGRPIKTVWLVGDRHANAYVSAANNPRAPGVFSVILSSGISHHGLNPFSGETWDYSYGYDNARTKPVQQYMRGTLAQDTGLKRISLFAESIVTKGTNGTDPATWVCTKDTNWAGVTETYDYV